MKKLLLLLVLTFSITCFAQEEKWSYPILPGTEAWIAFDTYQEKVNACQIPEDVLKTTSTSDLLDLCLAYPLLLDIYAFNEMSDGFNAYYSNFNGIRVFMTRTDAVEALRERYQEELGQQESLLNNAVVTLIEKGDYVFRVSAIEMFLGCPQLQSNLSSSTQKEIVKNLLTGYEKKHESLSVFTGLGFHANVYARANIVNKLDPTLLLKAKNKNITRLLKGVNDDAGSVEELDQISYSLIKE